MHKLNIKSLIKNELKKKGIPLGTYIILKTERLLSGYIIIIIDNIILRYTYDIRTIFNIATILAPLRTVVQPKQHFSESFVDIYYTSIIFVK